MTTVLEDKLFKMLQQNLAERWTDSLNEFAHNHDSQLDEGWSQKYKKSINCSHPKGFSQKAHCAGKKKHNESHDVMEATCPDCGMCKTHGNMSLNEIKKGQKDSNGFTKCWPGKHAEGTKKGKNGKPVRNCVPNESQGVAEGSGDLKSELAAVYSKLAPKIERHRDSFGAGQLYDALEAVADKHGAGKQLAIMMRSARNSAHMEYDTNPGGFENWFWFLPFATDDEQGVVEGAPIVVMPSHKRLEKKHKPSLSRGMDPAKAQGEQDARDGKPYNNPYPFKKELGAPGNWEHNSYKASYDSVKQGVAEGLPQTLRKVVPGYAKREIDKKMDDQKFGKTDVDKDANYYRYKKIQDKLKEQGVAEDWNKINHHDKTNGLSQKAVNAYRHEHPGSKLKTAVTTKPSKLKAGSKDANRRKSFCARMSGNEGPMKKPNGKPTPKALALRRWNCESVEELNYKILMAEQELDQLFEKSTTEKQARTMAAAAHDPKFAKKLGIKQSIAKEFNKADTGTKQLSNAMKHKKNKGQMETQTMNPSYPFAGKAVGQKTGKAGQLKGTDAGKLGGKQPAQGKLVGGN
jgi:hypothetical protein